MGFFIFLIIAFFIIKSIFFSGGSGSSEGHSHQGTSNGSTYYPAGQFETGFYIEQIHVYAKGPVFTYDTPTIKDECFYVFGEGELQISNSTGELKIALKKISDNRIVPMHFYINGSYYPVIDRYGNTYAGIDYTTVSVGRTAAALLNELEASLVDQHLYNRTCLFLKELLVFNMLVKRKIITSYSNHYITVSNADISTFYQTFDKLSEQAFNLMDKYITEGTGEMREDYISELLKILELPTDTRDLNVIRNQYKQLAKKYHPDRNKGTEETMKKINVAYEEICEYLKAS
ncbi:J domain-containing protein [Bacillus sp. AFS001701]|uniref:J domain-containing protein n=1 Tax=Bacillus sp. AFS001701 TaxID=2033480 RepID=UPI001C3F0825|nr:J domain-containing protein [Bacillus sp. AFS001701]